MNIESAGEHPRASDTKSDTEVKKSVVPKNQRPNFEEYLASIEEVVSKNDKRSNAIVVGLIKRGFVGGFNSEQLQKTIEVLRKWPNVDRIAVRLGVDHRNRRMKPFARQLFNGLRLGFVMSLDYPLQTASGQDQRSLVLKWLVTTSSRDELKQPDSEGKANKAEAERNARAIEDRELRMKFVCLIGESDDSLVCDGIYGLLKTSSRKKEKNSFVSSPRQTFTKLVGTILSAPRVALNALDNILKASAPMLHLVTSLEEECLAFKRRLDVMQRRESELEESEAQLTETVRQAREEIVLLKTLAEERRVEIESWNVRYQALDKHWQEVVKEQLLKQARDIKRNITHELNEAQLSLGGSQPDMRMASDRMARIQQILKGL
jgi:hypothetical protein